MVILEDGGAPLPTIRPVPRRRSAPVFAVYFLALFLVGLLSDYFMPTVSLAMSAAEFSEEVGKLDASSFLSAAIDVARHGWITPGNYWVIHLWPPGFVVLEGWVLRLFGEQSPFLIPLLVLSALACAAWMLLLRKYLLGSVPAKVATLLPALPFLFPVAPFFLLSPLGLSLGETFAISSFIIGFLLVLLAARNQSMLLATGAGLALALSAYFRSQFEVLVLGLTAAALVLFVVAALARLAGRPALVARGTVAVVLVSVIVAQLAMAPWRYHNYRDSGRPVWIHALHHNALIPEAELIRIGGGWIVQGGGHLACKLEPSFCGKKESEYFYRAFFRNPFTWIWEKAKLLPTYWLAPPERAALTNVPEPPSVLHVIANLLLLGAIIASFWRLWRIRREPEFAVQAWFQLSFYGCLAAVYTLAHLEARYFYLPKIFAPVGLLSLLVTGRMRADSVPVPRAAEFSLSALVGPRLVRTVRRVRSMFSQLSSKVVILEDGGAPQPTVRSALRGRSARAFAVYFLALFLVGLLSDYFMPIVSLAMPAGEYSVRVGMQDPHSFITGALDVARHGWITPANYWLVRIWPPGLMVLEGWVLRLFGEESPFLIPLLVLSALACAAWMLLLRKYLLGSVPAKVATLLPALPFLFPVAPFFLLSPLGLSFGETFAISSFIIGFLLVLLAARNQSMLLATGAGLALALSAYFRSQFEVLVLGLTAAALVLFVVAALARLAGRPALVARGTVAVVLVSVIVAQLAMAPWRYHNYRDSGRPVWIHALFHNALLPEQELIRIGGGWIVQGGGHLACKLEPSFCGKKENEYFYRAFFRNPFTWIWEKAKLLPAYWLAPPVWGALAGVGAPTVSLHTLANLLLAGAVFASFWRLWRIRREPEFAVQAWFQLSFYGCLAAVYTLAHLEARYLYLPKIFAPVGLLSLLVTGQMRAASVPVSRARKFWAPLGRWAVGTVRRASSMILDGVAQATVRLRACAHSARVLAVGLLARARSACVLAVGLLARAQPRVLAVVYFLPLCGLGLLLAGYVTPHLTWGMPAAEFARAAGYQDPSSFITGALDIARHGWVTAPNYWLVRLWPPGYMVLEGSVLRLFGEESAFLLPLLVLSALCCAGWMLLLRKYLLPVMSAPLATLAPALPFVFPVTPFFLFSPLGLGFGEGFAISFFITGFLLLLLAARNGSLRLAVLAGLALALSAYFRSQFELLVVVLTVTSLVLLALAVVPPLLKRGAVVERATVSVVLVSMIVAQVAMLPWRYHNYKGTGELAWVYTAALVARNSLTPEQELVKGGASFIVQGGGHLACKLEPSFCGKTETEYFYRAFLQNPLAWGWEKAKLLPSYWLAPPVPASISSLNAAPTIPQVLVNLLLFALVVAGLWRLWRIRREPEFAVQAWFQLSFYGCLAAVYTFAHLEARYFYLPKIFAVVALLTLLVPGRARRAPNNEVKP